MNCQRAQRLMEPEGRRTMTPQTSTAFEAHLARCTTCNETWREERLVSAHLAATPLVEPPAGLEAALLALPRTVAPGGPTAPAPEPKHPATQPSPAFGARPMTLAEWLRTFAVLLALGTLAGLGGSRRGSDPTPAHLGALVEQAAAPAATRVVRREKVDLSQKTDSHAANVPEAPTAVVAERTAPVRPTATIPVVAAVPPTPIATATSDATAPQEGTSPARRQAKDEADSSPPNDEAPRASAERETSRPPTVIRDRDPVMQPAAPHPEPDEPAGDHPPAGPAVRTQRATIPIHVFADVGGADVVGCRGCDGHLSQSDRDVAAREGLILPPFQISVQDHRGEVLLERAFTPMEPEVRAQLEVDGFAPFTVRIYVQSQTWLPCANLDISAQVAAPPMLSALRFPLVDTCPPPPRPADEDPPAIVTPRALEHGRDES